ncbi:PucR family transcriptional regulator [Paenibacillus mendelii]|uniref:PucR family transcriptional regulator n=1 Tax=Paenibacillus mendelii TaxID=206163 RepID=A0ABV6JMN4_9BACL|nr:helix-turn-helix domain-containing protein [Paenibacillus mendelii]MCQ6562210.1 helix-turn-helix domain-containing protein [Paenibacillus mendelii]
MSEANWMEQLEKVIARPIRQLQVPIQEWNNLVSATDESHRLYLQKNTVSPGDCMKLPTGLLWFAVRGLDLNMEVIEVDSGSLTETEIRLISWTLSQLKTVQAPSYAGLTDSERHANELGAWIVERLDSGDIQTSVPDRLVGRGKVFTTMIPFLLVSEQTELGRTSYSELEKLLRTFLAEEVMLIPLQEQEWLVLGPVSLIRDAQSEDREDESEESLEESLASIAMGLHEMLASEWIGECHLTVSHPISPIHSIVATAALLRETVNLGRAFHVGTNIHFPWLLHLERLLSTIPEIQRVRFVEQALKRTDVFLEPEILTTLETFFSLDCNVSETAKKLYIHRNTLLYRLDKLKQETELDVRQFRDAVLVKIILLLYKVTKRK